MSKAKFVTAYVNPDLDGYACVYAYTEFLNKTGVAATPWISGDLQDEINFVNKKFDIPEINPTEAYHDSKIISVDSSDLMGLGRGIDPNKIVEIIDHRPFDNEELFPNAKIQIEKVGSAATLIAEKFKKYSIEISKESTALLYSAIVSNTLNFQANVTTERDRKMAEWLNQQLKLDDEFAWEMFESKSDLSGHKLRESMQSTLGKFHLGTLKVCIIQIEMVGAAKLVSERKDEIISEMNLINNGRKLDGIFMTISELKDKFNLYVTADTKLQKMISESLNIIFEDSIAMRSGLLMRKELVPILKNYCEENNY